MAKKVMSMAITNDFKPVLNALNLLCDKIYLNKSKVLRVAIRKEVKLLFKKNKDNPDVVELLKQYPDVKELIERIALLCLQYSGVNT